MLSRFSALGLILVTVGLTGCSTTAPYAKREVFYDSALNDRNRAPASMTPPRLIADGAGDLDPVYMRTQADYYFAAGEALSLDSHHSKAVEFFKLVLVYDPESAQVRLRLAAEYVKMGMISEAIDYAAVAAEKKPGYVDAHLLLGGLLSTMKMYDKAIQQYQKALEIDPRNGEAPMYLGAVFAEQKQYDKAVQYFEKLTKNEDFQNGHLAWYYIGRIRAEQGGKAFMKQAEMAYHKAIEIKPDHFESILAMGQIFVKMGDENKAIEFYRKYQRERGPSTRLAELLGQSYLEREQYDDAIEQFEILERYSEDSLNAKVKIALILIEQKKYEPAIVKLKEVLGYAPDSDKIRFYLAAIYEEMGQGDEAISQFTKIPQDSQYFGEAVVHATYLLKQQKMVEKALGFVVKAKELRPDIPQFYAIHASLLDEKGEFSSAEAVLNQGVEKFPENVQLQFFLGTVSDRLGHAEKVVLHMNKVIEMDPNHVQGLNYLAFTYAEKNHKLDEAESLVRRALDIEPNDGFVMDTLGWILFKKGQIGESIKVLEAAFKIQPQESVIAEHLGDAYSKLKLIDKAKRMYEHAIETELDERKAHTIRQKMTGLEEQRLKKTTKATSSVRLPASADSGQ